jgi:hypothetical protein
VVDASRFTPERAAALALFAARSAALRAGDLTGWLAQVDPDQPALRAAQTTLFTNLRQLPLASYAWTFDATTQVEGDPVPAAVKSSLTGATQVYSPGMSIRYQLRGFDAGPVADEYVPVLLRRGGTWYLAGDRTQPDSFGQALVEPWTQGPVKVKVTRHSLVVVSASDVGWLPALSAQADAAVAAVVSLWPKGWTHTAVLYATRSRDVFATFLGREADVSLDDAVTLGVGLPRQVRQHESTRVVLNPEYVVPGYSRMAPILRHEFTHVATWAIEQDGTPLWVTEGIAEYTAYRGHTSQQRVPNQIGKDARAHRMSPRLPATSTFYGGRTQAYHYGVAWLAWEYMSETYGESKLRTMYLRLASISQPADSVAALKAENEDFVAVLHLPESSFVRSLNAWVAQVLQPV